MIFGIHVYQVNNSYTFCDILMIFGINVYQVNTVWRARMGALPCWSFELSPFNEFYRGKLMRSKTLISYYFRYFAYIW